MCVCVRVRVCVCVCLVSMHVCACVCVPCVHACMRVLIQDFLKGVSFIALRVVRNICMYILVLYCCLNDEYTSEEVHSAPLPFPQL